MSEPSPWTLRQRLIKRSLDLALTVPALVVVSPLIGLAALAARIDTGQSGIFRQQRVGKDGRVFTCYKIRTMRRGGGSTVTSATDARVTRLGRWLRRSKVDELPQLVNVVRGQMSLVGPRPDVPGFADLLAGPDRVVLSVPPGITGPATLYYRDEEGLLASVDDPELYNTDVLYPAKVRMNVEYVRHQSLRVDLHYLTRTLLQAVGRIQRVSRSVP